MCMPWLTRSRLLFALFHLLFICAYQLALLFAISGWLLLITMAARGGGEVSIHHHGIARGWECQPVCL